jgi:hypothetical protein
MNLQKLLNSLSLRQVLIIAGILDALWAGLVATFGANLLHILGVAGGASATSVGIGTVLAWLITFIVALLQGAVSILVIGFIGFVFWSIFSSK